MHVRAQAYHLPKGGREWHEYEDACSPRHWKEIETGGFRCAVADGATESSFAKTWARLLVHSYTACPKTVSTQEWIREGLAWLQIKWWGRVARKPVPWYVEEKLYQGAFAAFLGLEITPDNQWSAVSAGDCCMFHLRGDELLESFPFNSSSEFPVCPELVPSRGRLESQKVWRSTDGSWLPGDVFYLMTDSLARWCLTCIEQNLAPWEALPDWKLRINHGTSERRKRFQRWIGELSKTGLLKNDDVTLIRVDFFQGT